MCIRDSTWTAYDLGSKGGVAVNGKEIDGSAQVQYGDVIALGGVETVLLPLSPEEKAKRRENRRRSRPVSPWLGLVLLTVFQVLTALQLTISEGENATAMIPLTFLLFTGVMWLYFLVLRATGRVGFEMETIAFFLSTLSLAVTCSSNTGALFKQFLCVVLGLSLIHIAPARTGPAPARQTGPRPGRCPLPPGWTALPTAPPPAGRPGDWCRSRRRT